MPIFNSANASCWCRGSGFRVKEAKPAAMGAVAFAAGPNMVFFLKKKLR